MIVYYLARLALWVRRVRRTRVVLAPVDPRSFTTYDQATADVDLGLVRHVTLWDGVR